MIRFEKENPPMSQNQIAAQRLYLTEDKSKLVGEGDTRAATLYAAEGDEIPAAMAEKFGLVDGKLKPKKAAEPKGESKPAAKPETKPATSSETKPANAPATKPAGDAENKGA
jgi:hypothetical protein